ncbi:hypothetical protein NCS55_00241600 [Fusarium keratoplasticum]|nr:hypothetical protein NCS55_00241600 [Fusarium keratoplasticum]
MVMGTDRHRQVLGIDISPHVIPESPPDNMELQVDDLNGRFTFQSNHFDVVHNAREYEIGWSNNENVNQLLYSLALYPFTQFLGMSFNDFQLLVAQARSEAGNPAFKVNTP